jgi:transcription-repair coupling factor (superfamily II helicase)
MPNNPRLLELRFPTAADTRLAWRGLHGASTSLAIAETMTAYNGPICVIAKSAAAVEQLQRELNFFCASVDSDSSHVLRRFPDYETLPYEPLSPPKDLLADRLATLSELAQRQRFTLLVNAEVLLNRLPPRKFVRARSIRLEVRQRLDRNLLAASLVNHGYLRVDQVVEPGEIALRGAVTDIFPPGSARPLRIDFFDDEIESLRFFDPATQLSDGQTEFIDILPAREFPFDQDAITGFRQRFREHFPGEPGRSMVYRDISESLLPAGIEYYLPLFFDQTCSLVDYLAPETLLLVLEDALTGLTAGWELIQSRYEQLAGDIERPCLPPEQAFHTPTGLLAALKEFPTVELSNFEADNCPSQQFETAHPLSGGVVPDSDRIRRWLESESEERSLLLASSPGRREVLLEFLRNRDYSVATVPDWQSFVNGGMQLAVGVGELEQGLRLPAAGLRIITAEQIGLERPRQQTRRRRSARDPATIISELTDLRIGAPVVHEDYGVGRYQGLSTLDVDGVDTEFLLLEYAGGDKLYVPVQNLHLVTRYSGASPEQAPLHRLGSDQWSKAKRKAAQAARDVAAELLNIYAQRAAREAESVELDAENYVRFAAEFPFEETDDQLGAITDLIRDLASGRPMDRIICGDVGFGKTEVALRAAFVAAQAGHQVAILVPTTLLCQQHMQTFADRFADWPIEIEMLSRFRSTKEVETSLARIADGSADIVIGTHKLLQSDVHFKRLGLVIIDEEHRFGVKHKEQLKRLRADVHVLTMTATPIPRTLNMSLGGLRDLSIIATPPAERLSVRTFVGEWSDQGIREAVLRELRRGGQIYVVHNRVQDIEAVATRLRDLLPETEIRVAHGQMSERALETVMLDFYHRRFAVLVCTTIIESGIDVPTANTIVINRADHLGLAQLHQLRGRVGRSHHQAYAYLLAPPLRSLTADAAKRLEVIAALEELGSGFALATHDLEIRGAGELLGEGQSGQIQAIGFTLYNELLARAVQELREGREPELDDPFRHGPEIETGLPTLIPEDYMPDVHMRLVQYKRIANSASREELDNLQVEMINRFGLLAPQTKTLFAVTWLKILATELGIRKIQAGPRGARLIFSQHAAIDPERIVRLIQSDPDSYKLDGPVRLRCKWADESELHPEQRVERIEQLLRTLGAEGGHAEAA